MTINKRDFEIKGVSLAYRDGGGKLVWGSSPDPRHPSLFCVKAGVASYELHACDLPDSLMIFTDGEDEWLISEDTVLVLRPFVPSRQVRQEIVAYIRGNTRMWS